MSHVDDELAEARRSTDWYDDESELEVDGEATDQYDLSISPNDFNTRTIFDFIETGAVSIPGFQRNYVWDIKRASKLIESLIVGLPVPQIFLYEEGRNKFLVIDGQQRLMSIYYFIKQRFPLMEKRPELRRIAEEADGQIPPQILYDDRYFTKFSLRLPRRLDDKTNRFHGLNYETLGDYKTTLDMRTVRNIIVKQLVPDDDSAMYEIFNRLNTGGVNLAPQEIRSSLYHSAFYSMLFRLNMRPNWRRLLGIEEPDLHSKDVEFLLRGFAMVSSADEYNPSMTKFLNTFSMRAKHFDTDRVQYLERFFESFLASCDLLDEKAFRTVGNRFSVTAFESVLYAVGDAPMRARGLISRSILPESVAKLRANPEFSSAASKATTNSSNVATRLRLAREMIELR